MRLNGGEVLLSGQESAVLGLLYGGRTNREIAGQLAISTSTVNSHVAAMLRGLGLCSRGDLVLWAAQHPTALLRHWTDYHTHPIGCPCLTLPYCAWRREQIGAAPMPQAA